MKYRVGFICQRPDYGLQESLYKTALSFGRSYKGLVAHSVFRGPNVRVDVFYSLDDHCMIALTFCFYSVGDFVSWGDEIS